MFRTYTPNKEEIERKWYVVDADGKTLGRLSTDVARVLSGKHKPIYAPHIDTGDFVIVINAEKVALSGQKEEQKIYYRHSTYAGGLKSETAARLRKRQPSRIIQKAVKGMLPKNRIGRRQLKKLKIYAGAEHPHVAQQPEPFPVV